MVENRVLSVGRRFSLGDRDYRILAYRTSSPAMPTGSQRPFLFLTNPVRDFSIYAISDHHFSNNILVRNWGHFRTEFLVSRK